MRISAPKRASVQRLEVWDLGYGRGVDLRRLTFVARVVAFFCFRCKVVLACPIPALSTGIFNAALHNYTLELFSVKKRFLTL